MNFYSISSSQMLEDYAIPGEEINIIEDACDDSAFQFLDHSPLPVPISAYGGLEFPDFILHNSVIPLVSDRLYQALVDLRLDNLFFKPVFLNQTELGIRESYHLALPPRIDCLDWSASEIDEDDDPLFWMRLHRARKIVIDENKIGNYRIFKLPANILNHDIIVCQDVKDFLESKNFHNLYFSHISGS